jgi:Uma2 family endonuclease
MWEGVLHMIPPPSSLHQRIGSDLLVALRPPADARGLVGLYESGLYRPGVDDDWRVPDLVFAREAHISGRGVEGSAELVVEILSPGDETYDKLGFYGDVGVREVLVVDPITRHVELFANRDGTMLLVQPDADGGLRATSLGVTFRTVEGPRLRVTAGASDIHV